MNVTYPTSALATEAYACVTSTGLGTGGVDYLIYNGPMSGASGLSYPQTPQVLTVSGTPPTSTPPTGPTDNYSVNLYAGSESTQCGSSFTNGPLATGSTPPGSTATPGTSAAPALNSDAENESITDSVTMTYSG
jgi:hypothetical protein